MFGYKANTKFGRILWYVFATCICILLLDAAIEIVWGYVNVAQRNKVAREQQRPEYCHDYWNHQLSYCIIYHEAYDDGYVYSEKLGRRTITGISWICESEDGDELVCFSNGKRRGYFDRYTGELAIQPKYEKAWVFSEGLACVMLEGKLGFIDHEGNMVIGNTFNYSPNIGIYCFHNGLCIMKGDNSLTGLIDKQGNWYVEPIYKYVNRVAKGCWEVKDTCNRYGLLDENGQTILPCEYSDVRICYDGSCIKVVTMDHVDQVFDFEGNMINACSFYEIDDIYYTVSDKYDECEHGLCVNKCLKYSTIDGYYGLMDRRGNMITLPIYTDIFAITVDRFLCKSPFGSVILDEKGNEVGEKL